MSEKTVDLTISKSRTVKIGEEYVKAEYTITAKNLDLAELDAAKIELMAKIDSWLSELGAPKPPTPIPLIPPATPTPAPAKPHPSTYFPEDLRSLLTFEEHPDHWVIKPRSYLGSENFSRIASIIREKGGEYVSAGKESHFKLPR